MATILLKKLQDAAPVDVSVGDLPVPATEGGSEIEDGREPVELLARILAHAGHRIPGLRSVEKKLEGTDAKSGMLSDIIALISQLISRNDELALKVGEEVLSDVLKKKPKADKVPVQPIQGHFDDPEPTQ